MAGIDRLSGFSALQKRELFRRLLSELTNPGREDRWLIIGNYGNGNTGDEAILAGLFEAVPEQVVATVVSRNPAAVTAIHGVTSVRTFSVVGAKAALRSRVIVIGGGGMFGYGIPRAVALLPYFALLLRLLGKRVVYASIGAYADMPSGVRRALQLSARTAALITTRDEASAQLLTSGLASDRTATIIGDPADWLETAPHEVSLFTAAGARELVISLKAMPDLELLDSVLRKIAVGVAQSGIDPRQVTFLCLSDQGDYGLGADYSDRRLAERVASECFGEDAPVRFAGPGIHPRVAKRLVAGAHGVLAMRLHAQIFASSCGVDLLALPFEEKSRAWVAGVDATAIAPDELQASHVAEWISRRLPKTRRRTGYATVAAASSRP